MYAAAITSAAMVKDIIRNTTDIAVSPCVCYTVQGHCDNPINTCFGLNFYGQLKKKAGERSVSVDECFAVADMAHKNGLISVIESCVQPYQDNLCFCCTCCSRYRHLFQKPLLSCFLDSCFSSCPFLWVQFSLLSICCPRRKCPAQNRPKSIEKHSISSEIECFWWR